MRYIPQHIVHWLDTCWPLAPPHRRPRDRLSLSTPYRGPGAGDCISPGMSGGPGGIYGVVSSSSSSASSATSGGGGGGGAGEGGGRGCGRGGGRGGGGKGPSASGRGQGRGRGRGSHKRVGAPAPPSSSSAFAASSSASASSGSSASTAAGAWSWLLRSFSAITSQHQVGHRNLRLLPSIAWQFICVLRIDSNCFCKRAGDGF